MPANERAKPIVTSGRPAGGYEVAGTNLGARPPGGYEVKGKLPAAKPLQPWIKQPPLSYEGPCTYVPPRGTERSDG